MSDLSKVILSVKKAHVATLRDLSAARGELDASWAEVDLARRQLHRMLVTAWRVQSDAGDERRDAADAIRLAVAGRDELFASSGAGGLRPPARSGRCAVLPSKRATMACDSL